MCVCLIFIHLYICLFVHVLLQAVIAIIFVGKKQIFYGLTNNVTWKCISALEIDKWDKRN